MMKLGTQMGFYGCIGMSEEEAYKTIAELGFSSVDYPLMAGYTSALWQLSDEELKKLHASAEALKAVIKNVTF